MSKVEFLSESVSNLFVNDLVSNFLSKSSFLIPLEFYYLKDEKKREMNEFFNEINLSSKELKLGLVETKETSSKQEKARKSSMLNFLIQMIDLYSEFKRDNNSSKFLQIFQIFLDFLTSLSEMNFSENYGKFVVLNIFMEIVLPALMIDVCSDRNRFVLLRKIRNGNQIILNVQNWNLHCNKIMEILTSNLAKEKISEIFAQISDPSHVLLFERTENEFGACFIFENSVSFLEKLISSCQFSLYLLGLIPNIVISKQLLNNFWPKFEVGLIEMEFEEYMEKLRYLETLHKVVSIDI